MRTKLPFAGRSLFLSCIMLCFSGTVAYKLVNLQLLAHVPAETVSEKNNIETEILPAERGIIMDRNREVLTNNVLVAEVQINRHAMREIDQVTYGLAYNQLIHTPEWQQITDPAEREKKLRDKRLKLLEAAKVHYDAEERAKIHRESLHNDAAANLLLQYDEKICQQYYAAHDELVAELLARFTAKAPNGEALTKEEIINKIAQPEKVKLKKEAEAKGEKSPVDITQLIYLIKELSMEDAEVLQEMLDAMHIHGVIIRTGMKRHYMVPHMLTHILGTVRKEDGTGVGGVEGFFNDHLAGTPGRREYRKNVRGQIIPHEDDRYQEPQHGLNLQLTVDMRIQAICEEELDKGLQELKCPVGCMIVMEAVSGDVLAMVNRPAFNLNTRDVITPTGTHEYGKYIDREGKTNNGDRNYACQTSYEPGSTFKPVAVLTAIDKGKATIGGYVSSNPFSLGGKLISDGKRSGRLSGGMTVGCALKHSCNPATVNVLMRCSWKEYNHYLDKLGLLDKLGIDLPAVSPGSARNKNRETCSAREMASMAYGYAITVSPMHLAQVYTAIANGGVRVKPRLVDRMITPDGDVYDECAPRPGDNERVMKRSTGSQILKALLSVTDPDPRGEKGRGTAHTAHIPGFKIGGKTGTAEKVVNGQYISKFHVASFAGIFPLDENINWEAEMAKPKEQRKKVYVVFTVVDGVAGGGGTAAAPIFKRVAERMIQLENIKPTDPEAYEAYLRKKEAAENPEKKA